MTRDIRQALAANAARRHQLVDQANAAEDEERDLIAEAWRAGLAPGEIANLAARSGAYVRKLRPDDVPPARMGGMAAAKQKRRRRS